MDYHEKNQIILYISAAADLEPERDLLGRAVTEVPVTLGWRIVQSPGGNEPADLEAVAEADLHLLLLGGDIRAPIGQEWIAARRAGRRPVLLLKQGILRTSAGQNFERFISEQAAWQPFRDGAELRQLALKLLASHLLARAGIYGLSAAELARLQAWRAELEEAPAPMEQGARGVAGESGVVLSRERYVPSEGVLIQPRDDRD
jgi:hypothetical protein